MPTYDLTPDATTVAWSHTLVGAATVHEALADSDDGTYISCFGYSQFTAYLGLSDPSSPTGRLCSIGCLLRGKTSSGGTGKWQPLLAIENYPGPYELAGKIAMSESWADHEVLAHEGIDPDRSAFAGAPSPMANALGMQAKSDGSGTVYLSRLLARLYYLGAVTCDTPSAPAGTVEDTQMPECTVELTLTVEDWQLPSGLPTFLTGGDVEFRIYDSADVTGAEPPAGVTPVWSTIVRFTETTVGAQTPEVSATPDVPLPNGDYVLFTRASRDLISGSQMYWSDWEASAEWTQDLVLPDDPTLACVADDAAQSVVVTVNAPATAGYDSDTGELELQRQLADGTWRDVRGLTGVAIAIGSNVEVGSDYEAPRGAESTWRARASMELTSDGIRHYSAWVEKKDDGPALTGWNLKTVEDPSTNWLGAAVLAGPGEEDQGESAVFKPLYRDRPVVVRGMVSGAGGSLEVRCIGATAIGAAEDLIAYGGLVLLETAFGDAKYVGITAASWVRRGTASSPRRNYVLAYTEVSCDLPTTDV